jgi:hypothetical protein
MSGSDSAQSALTAAANEWDQILAKSP